MTYLEKINLIFKKHTDLEVIKKEVAHIGKKADSDLGDLMLIYDNAIDYINNAIGLKDTHTTKLLTILDYYED